MNERNGRDCGEDIDKAGQQVDPQGPLFRRACGLPEHLAEIEDDIDADELLKSRQAYGYPNHRGD